MLRSCPMTATPQLGRLSLALVAPLALFLWFDGGLIERAVAVGGALWCVVSLAGAMTGVMGQRRFPWTSSHLSPLTARAVSWGPPVVVSLAGLWLYSQLLSSTSVPSGADHTVHAFHAMVMADHLLPEWQLTGWSHLQFAGVPEFDLYGPLPYVFIALLSWLPGDGMTLYLAYNLVLVSFIIGLPLAVYAFLVSHGASRLTATLTALLLLTDRGLYDEGGWEQPTRCPSGGASGDEEALSSRRRRSLWRCPGIARGSIRTIRLHGRSSWTSN